MSKKVSLAFVLFGITTVSSGVAALGDSLIYLISTDLCQRPFLSPRTSWSPSATATKYTHYITRDLDVFGMCHVSLFHAPSLSVLTGLVNSDGPGARALTGAAQASETNTVESCISFCESKNFVYAGTEYGVSL